MALLVNAQGVAPLQMAAPTVPLTDNLLLDHRREILERDFPFLNQDLPKLQQHQFATQLEMITTGNEAHQAAQEATKAKAAEKVKAPS